MRKSRFAAWTWTLVLALAVGGLAVGFGPSGRVIAEEHKHTPLEDAMDAMNKALRTLKTQAADVSKQASNLELVSEMQKQMVLAKSLTPARAESLQAADKQKFLIEYRKAMVGLIGELLKLEAAFLDGKTDDAQAIIKNLNKIKTDGHEKFQVE
jgi:soluble cytochrome b562